MNVLAILPGFIPSTIIGVLRPLAELKKRGEINCRVRLYNIPFRRTQDIDWCDVAIFCRNCEIKDLSCLYELKRKGKKIIYELDDNFEEIPLTTAVGSYHQSFFRLHVLKRFFTLSDVTRVYSDRLLERVIAHGTKAQVIRSYFDKSLIDGITKNASDGIIRIAYPSARIDDNEMEEMIFSSLRTILKKYEGKVEFHLWRKSTPKQLIDIKGVVLNKPLRDYDNFIRTFFKIGFDIGVAPGIDTPFFHSKTNNKYREFGGCEIAGVYSNLPPYANSVSHECTGLLVGNSKEDWVVAIDRLINDNKLRGDLAKNARDDVFRNYSFNSSIQSWLDCLNLIINKNNDVLTEWLPRSKKAPCYTYIALSKTEEIDPRIEHLRSALNLIPESILMKSSIESYIKNQNNYRFSTSVIFLRSKNELEILSILLKINNSIILDISTYKYDLEEVVQLIHRSAESVKISVLCSFDQAAKYKLVEQLRYYTITIDEKIPNFKQNFTLYSYPAAYLDLVERHINFTLIKKTSELRSFANLWNGRIQTFSMWIRWLYRFR